MKLILVRFLWEQGKLNSLCLEVMILIRIKLEKINCLFLGVLVCLIVSRRNHREFLELLLSFSRRKIRNFKEGLFYQPIQARLAVCLKELEPDQISILCHNRDS